MSIKLYKSQLEPTAKSSNVANKAFVSMAEAGSIGRAWKGMVQSGEKLYAKHIDIKTDNEVLEKTKEVMNGSDKFEGLSATTLRASNMNDPDAAGKVYNDAWQTVFDNVNGSLSGKMAQRKFKAWMTKQNIKDVNAIKNSSTVNMINTQRVNTLDEIETLKKSVIFGTKLESDIAAKDLSDKLGSQKYAEIFGEKLQTVIKQTNNEIAFHGYKRMPYTQKEEVLAAALKDKRITKDDYLELEKHFNAVQTTDNNLNKDNVSKMKSNLDAGILFTEDEFNSAIAIATQNQDEKTLLKLKQMATDAPIIQDLNTKTVAQIEEKINFFTAFKNKQGGMTTEEANELRISQEYLAALNTSLDKDPLGTAADKGLIALSEINFEDILNGGDMSAFVEGATNRIAQAETASSYYKREVKYLTATEANTIKNVFNNADTAEQIIALSTGITKAFGVKSDKVFKQISKDDNILSHLGGLVIMNDGVAGENVKLAAKGFLLSKEANTKAAFVIGNSNAELTSLVAEYSQVFGVDGTSTYNNTIQAANYIYAAKLQMEGKNIQDDFNKNDWKDAFHLAAGGSIVDGMVFDKKMGGVDETTRGTMVHIPSWLENGKFENVIDMLKDNPELVLKSSSNNKMAVSLTGEEFSNIFTNEDPYFVSIGNGKYKVANGDNPFEGGDPEYLLNSDGGYFVIDINKIKADIITGIK